MRTSLLSEICACRFNSGLFLAVKKGPYWRCQSQAGARKASRKLSECNYGRPSFYSVNFEGFYTLSIEFGTSNGMHAFRTVPFEIRSDS